MEQLDVTQRPGRCGSQSRGSYTTESTAVSDGDVRERISGFVNNFQTQKEEFIP
ncbi:Uncharacterised protein [Mycobacteroides abscessus subsp. massiliense]|nr:Uncharacterised protein [Mycobacteroides abscessus subsp. massiliense]